ncbi:hypothetical protein ACT4ML_18845 [Natrinema sp. LN54]|uniref:hypothetical protein n=1 Tax=Natrinema sp. LN54 TaxID=3458705 RepID=UPI004035CFB3
MSDDAESSADDELTLDGDSIAANTSQTGRQPVRCPRCDVPIALVVSYGPTTHEASPCGCRVPGDILERSGDGSE